MKKQNTIYLTMGLVAVIILIIAAIVIFSAPKGNETIKPIKIGVLLPMSGPAQIIGDNIRSGFDEALPEINKNGKIIELIYEDNKNDPKEAVTAFQKLTTIDNVDMIITTMSGTSAAIVPLAKEKNIPLIATVVYFNVPKVYNNSVQMFVRPEDEANALIESVDKLNIHKLGLLYLQSDYGVAIKKQIETSLEKDNVEVISESYQFSDSSFQTQLLKLKESGVDTMYMITFPHTVATMIKEARELKFNGTIITNAPIYLNGMIGSNDIFEGTYTSAPSSYISRQDYPAGNKYIPYELLKLIGEEIKNGNQENLIESLASKSSIETKTHGIINIDKESKTAAIPLTIFQIKNKKLVAIQ